MKKRIMLISLAFLLIASVVGCAAPAPAPAPAPVPSPTQPAEVFKLKLQTSSLPASYMYQPLLDLVEELKQASGGRLVIEVFVGGSITPAFQESDGLIRGSLDAAAVDLANNFLHLEESAGLFKSVVGGFTPMQQYVWFLRGGGEELVQEWMRPLGIEWVGFNGPHMSEVWLMADEPVKSLAQLKTMKMRAVGESGVILGKMGIAVVPLGGGEIYEAWDRGVIDCLERDNLAGNVELGYHEIAKYIYTGPHRDPTNPENMLCRADVWASLPADLQKIFRDVSYYWGPRTLTGDILREDDARQFLLNYGCEIQPIPEEIDQELLIVAKEHYDEMSAKNPFYAKVREHQAFFKEACENAGLY